MINKNQIQATKRDAVTVNEFTDVVRSVLGNTKGTRVEYENKKPTSKELNMKWKITRKK